MFSKERLKVGRPISSGHAFVAPVPKSGRNARSWHYALLWRESARVPALNVGYSGAERLSPVKA